jgi:hypothetical protein
LPLAGVLVRAIAREVRRLGPLALGDIMAAFGPAHGRAETERAVRLPWFVVEADPDFTPMSRVHLSALGRSLADQPL